MFKLYLIVDQLNCHQCDIETVVTEAIKGGVDAVQLREKNASTQEIIELGKKLQVLLYKHNVPLIINDRVDIAMALNANGVHLGQKDMPYHSARKLLGNKKIIGISVSNSEQAHKAQQWDVNYLGIGPVFETSTKLDTSPVIGIEGLRRICSISKHPIIAIGGINVTNAHSVLSAGATGIATVSAICGANNPMLVSKQLFEIVSSYHAQ
ncbi:MAG: thiamine-phosphate pyrophosphorylase [Coxiella sp. DG_40]|nr:MAG: thiamine-phosphate pyrophosphorylase [Coxiella sp. DG_40]